MKVAHYPSAAAILVAFASVLLLLSPSISNARVCAEERLKPLRHVSGVVLDPYDRPIPNATTEILQGETQLLAVRTDEDGEFSFGHLEAGSYELRAQALGFHSSSYHISVVKPKAAAKRVLQIHLDVVYGCPKVRIIKVKHSP